MKLENEKVAHRAFGEGVVTKQEETMLTVVFGEPAGEKRFPYPDAFDGFLTLTNETLQKEIAHEVSLAKRKFQTEKRVKARARETRQAIMAEQLRAAAAEKKSTRSRKTAVKKPAVVKPKKNTEETPESAPETNE